MIGALVPPRPPLSKNERLIVGVSGGSDSVALLHLLIQQLPQAVHRLVVAHINYGLRGRESKKDEAVLSALCRQWDVPLRVLRLKKFKFEAQSKNRSIQDWARERRYSFFAKLTLKEKAWGVTVAHHQEDQAETILDRLLRGAGTRGLTGLKPVQKLQVLKPPFTLRVWRPLLNYSKRDLQAYLQSFKINWREDQSNHENHYRRNQIRNQIIPYLARWNPRISENLARMGEVSGAEDLFLQEALEKFQKTLRNHWRRSTYSGLSLGFTAIPLALQRRWVRQVAEKLNPDARGLSFDRIEDTVRVWNGSKKGPRHIGYGLVADQKNPHFLMTFHSKKAKN